MTKKKIIYVVTKSVWGGAQKYVYDLATNLPKDSFETMVVTGRSNFLSEPRSKGAGGDGLLVEKLCEAGIRTIVLEPLQKKSGMLSVLFDLVNLRLLFRLIKIFREERPDVIHLSSSKAGGIGGLAAWLSKRLNVPAFKPLVVFTVHGWPHKEDRPLPAKFAIWVFSWLSSLFHDKVILINTADFRTAKKFIPRRKLALIFNGIEGVGLLERTEARKFLAKKLGRPISLNTTLIGSCAELVANKGLIYMLRGLASYSTSMRLNLVFLIIGEGEERQRLERLIETAGLQKHVFLPGFIPDAARYLKGLDIFVLPSLKEGLPYIIMEAMHAGLPIVASNVGGIPDLIEHKKSGYLVEPKDTAALAEAIRELLEDRKMRIVMGETAKERVRARFTLHDMIEKTLALYLSNEKSRG